jgi:hypothetical protein
VITQPDKSREDAAQRAVADAGKTLEQVKSTRSVDVSYGAAGTRGARVSGFSSGASAAIRGGAASTVRASVCVSADGRRCGTAACESTIPAAALTRDS